MKFSSRSTILPEPAACLVTKFLVTKHLPVPPRYVRGKPSACARDWIQRKLTDIVYKWKSAAAHHGLTLLARVIIGMSRGPIPSRRIAASAAFLSEFALSPSNPRTYRSQVMAVLWALAHNYVWRGGSRRISGLRATPYSYRRVRRVCPDPKTKSASCLNSRSAIRYHSCECESLLSCSLKKESRSLIDFIW